METTWNGIRFSDEDVVNLDDWIPNGESNPHNVRPWIITGYGGTLAIVFADCEQNALDIAADNSKMEGFRILGDDLEKMTDEEQERLAYLGNHSDAFDLEGISIMDMPNPFASFCTLFDKEFGEKI